MEKNVQNHWLKKTILLFSVLCLFTGFIGNISAVKADADDNAIAAMKARQTELKQKVNELGARVSGFNMNDPRKEDLNDAYDDVLSAMSDFKSLDPDSHVKSGFPDAAFTSAEKNLLDKINKVNVILIGPTRPGLVPAGTLVEDFIPGIIRQLFRFAWLAVFIALTVSGIFMVISFDNEERLTKAKHMIYFTLIGFAFVTLAFAIVKAVTNIDFFNFI